MVSRDPSGGLGLVICLYMILLTIVDGWDSVITPLHDMGHGQKSRKNNFHRTQIPFFFVFSYTPTTLTLKDIQKPTLYPHYTIILLIIYDYDDWVDTRTLKYPRLEVCKMCDTSPKPHLIYI